MPATERPFFIFAATLSRRDARLRSELGRAELALSAAAVSALTRRVRFGMLAHSLAHINMAAQCEVVESERHAAGRELVCSYV